MFNRKIKEKNLKTKLKGINLSLLWLRSTPWRHMGDRTCSSTHF